MKNRPILVKAAAAGAAIALAAAGLTACTTTPRTDSPSSTVVAASSEISTFWDASTIHTLSIDVADADLTTMLSTYADTGEKVWISADITIDGTTLTNVGIKLKGNSTLKGTDTDTDPSSLPLLIRLDKYVDGQSYDGETGLVVRGSSTETSINEAVALELLGMSGLATEAAVETRFSVNGSDEALRLVIQSPDDDWQEAEFTDAGLLYKAEVGGDYSYRGDDPDSYTEHFDQEAGDDDPAPLIAFLKFINESDDATFASDLSNYLDVDAFATYLAFQDIVDNYDDIDGPGNNSYLRYDSATGVMTVVNWDLNLAFGSRPFAGGGAGGGVAGGGQAAPAGGVKGGAPAGGGGHSNGSNVLAERFAANADFAALVTAAKATLTASLITSGDAQAVVDRWAALLTASASDLVPSATVSSEAATVSAYFTAR